MSFFLAIDVSDDVRAGVAALIDARSVSTPAKWLRADKLHITLHYLGYPKPDALAALEPKVRAATSSHRVFSLRLASSGTFSTPRAARVLWLGVRGDVEALRALRDSVLTALGLDPFASYVPHLTFARCNDAAAAEAVATDLQQFESLAFTVSHVAMFESQNDRYREIFRVPLQG